MTATAQEIAALLSAPFDPREVQWKAQAVSGQRALAVCYIDARCVMDRLDQVVGISGWQDSYEFLPDGAVACRLRLRLGGEWVEKMDVGGQSEQPDEGDRRKAAVSDALKRTAVKFGVGRYLYSVDAGWVGYDPAKKQLTEIPRLPAWALPKAQKPAGKTLPATGTELRERLSRHQAELVKSGLCDEGGLLRHVVVCSGRAGELIAWEPPFKDVLGLVREYEADLAPGAPAVDQAGLDELLALLKAARRSWPKLKEHFGWPKRLLVEQTTPGMLDRIRPLLTPDVPTK